MNQPSPHAEEYPQYADVPNEPLNYGDAFTQQWGWQEHIINARIRVDALASALVLGMPPYLIRQCAEAIKERADALAEIAKNYPEPPAF